MASPGPATRTGRSISRQVLLVRGVSTHDPFTASLTARGGFSNADSSFPLLYRMAEASDEDAAFSRNAPHPSDEDGATSPASPTTETDPATTAVTESSVGGDDAPNEPFVPELAAPNLADTTAVENVPSPAAPVSSFPKMAVRSPEKAAESRVAAPRMMAPMAIAPAVEEGFNSAEPVDNKHCAR